jgi:hypothetical protein
MKTISKGIKFSFYAAAAALLFPFFSAADPWDEAGRIVAAIREPVFPQHALNVREQGAVGDGRRMTVRRCSVLSTRAALLAEGRSSRSGRDLLAGRTLAP